MSIEIAAAAAKLADLIFDIGKALRRGEWALVATPHDERLLDATRRMREQICAHLEHCTAGEMDIVLRSNLFTGADVPIGIGLAYQRTSVTEQRSAAAAEILETGWSHPMSRHAFAIAVLQAAPHEMPLMPDLHLCPDFIAERYITWLFRRPHFRDSGDDARYVAWLETMLEWLRDAVTSEPLTPKRGMLLNTILQKLDIGMIIYSDVSIRGVLDARARLIETVTGLSEALRGSRTGDAPARPAHRKIRLGFLIRTLLRHPDPIAFCSQFESFDLDRYEIIVYSHDMVDRQCDHDIALYRRIFAFVTEIRSLNGLTVQQMIDRVQGDDLDVFVFSYAATIGVTPTDCLVSAKLARVQVLMNSYVPLATGLPSFTHVATVRPHESMRASLMSECREQIAEIPRVLLSYLPARRETPDRVITRATLGIPAAAPVFYNGGAVDKIVPTMAHAWIRSLARVPGSYLVLAPFNPGWSGTQGATNLFALLDETCAAHGVDRSRVIVLRELSPRDTGQILDFTTVYFGTFPHGSSTSIALALQAKVPVVTRRSPWLRGTGDASIVESIGMHDLVAADADAYVDLAVRIATDDGWRAELTYRIAAALPTAPFLSSAQYTRDLQHMFDRLALDSFGYPMDDAELGVAA